MKRIASLTRLPTLILAILATAASPTFAQGPLPNSDVQKLSATLRSLLLKNLPDPLYESSPNWGHQSPAKTLRFHGKGLKARMDVAEVPKNDGLWRKIKIIALYPNDNLTVDLKDLKAVESGGMDFVLLVASTMKFDIVQQRWESGVRLYSTSLTGQARVKAVLRGHAESRIDTSKGLPELVIKLKITQADTGYDNLKIEHIAGIGGDGAKVLGEAAVSMINQWKPSIERDLLAKANGAIVKAGQDREIHLGFAKLLKLPAVGK